jgi:uncharacterized DUF497 family protein
MSLTFEWDEEKARGNLRKHKVTFEEAKTIYDDLLLWSFPDPDHSEGEERWVNIGGSARGRVLLVIHAERGGRIRLISCRKATPSERRAYEEGAS